MMFKFVLLSFKMPRHLSLLSDISDVIKDALDNGFKEIQVQWVPATIGAQSGHWPHPGLNLIIQTGLFGCLDTLQILRM